MSPLQNRIPRFFSQAVHPPAVAFAIAISDVAGQRYARGLGYEDDVPSEMPTDAEIQAHNLHDKQGLTDQAIAKMTGTHRVTITRRRHRFYSKVRSLRTARRNGCCPACAILEDLK